jgi:hypothetical protein
VSPVRYELGFYIPQEGIPHSHRRGNLKSYIVCFISKKVFYGKIYMVVVVVNCASERKDTLTNVPDQQTTLSLL